MFQYEQTNRYFAQVADGLEEMAAAELEALGGRDVKPAYRGLYFDAAPAALYGINYRSRLVTRVLAPLLRFDCHSDRYLYKTARDIEWERLLTPSKTFAVFANVSNSRIKHSQYAALKVKDAVADRLRDLKGARPDVDTSDPDVWINVHIHANKATISLDTSGGSLHKRGYRRASVDAPMQETVAAAIIGMSEWDGERPLYDPMCGSGTLLAEALMRASRVPAGFARRRFGFERMPGFDPAAWARERARADEAVRSVAAGTVAGSDASGRAVAAARENLAVIPGGGSVPVRVARFDRLDALEGVTVVCNPPHGIRMDGGGDIGELTRRFGDFLKQKCAGSSAFVYFGDRELVKRVGLRPSWRRPLKNGGLDGRLVKYELY